jgi:uncharacterized membrane protein
MKFLVMIITSVLKTPVIRMMVAIMNLFLAMIITSVPLTVANPKLDVPTSLYIVTLDLLV